MGWGGGTRLGFPRAWRKAVESKALRKQSAEPWGEAVLDTRTRTFLLVAAQKGPSFWQARDPRGVVRALGQATLQPRSKLSQIWGKTPLAHTAPQAYTFGISISPPSRVPHQGASGGSGRANLSTRPVPRPLPSMDLYQTCQRPSLSAAWHRAGRLQATNVIIRERTRL